MDTKTYELSITGLLVLEGKPFGYTISNALKHVQVYMINFKEGLHVTTTDVTYRVEGLEIHDEKSGTSWDSNPCTSREYWVPHGRFGKLSYIHLKHNHEYSVYCKCVSTEKTGIETILVSYVLYVHLGFMHSYCDYSETSIIRTNWGLILYMNPKCSFN